MFPSHDPRATGPNEQNVSITSPSSGTISANKIYSCVVSCDISGMICTRPDSTDDGQGDVFWFVIQRNGGDVSDTNNGDVDVFVINATVVKWCEGNYEADA